MAATDIQYGGLDPVLYTPDFTFLRYVLDKKTAQYEKGLESASSAFNNLKKELTDPVNAERRDKYLKDAEGILQKVASSDLSLQQNVNFANTVFDPVATDKAFLYDSYYTKKIKTELSKEEAWKNSENMEERKKYNGEIAEWVARDLDSLKNGKGDIANYKVQGRTAQAYVDAQDILVKAIADQGFKMKTDELGQPYVVSVEGGPQFRENYETFANNILANDKVYQKQAGILGQNRAEKVIEKYKTDPVLAPKWSNKSNKDIFADYAITSFNEHKKSQKEYLDALNKNYASQTASISAALNGPDSAKYSKGAADVAAGNNATPEAQMYTALKEKADNVNNLNGKLKDLNSDYSETYGDAAKEKKSLESYVNRFTENPDGYFSDLQFKNDVTRFSNIRSSFYTRKISPDKAYTDILTAKTNAEVLALKIYDTHHDNNVQDQKLLLDERKEDFKESLKGRKVKRNADGTTSIEQSEADIVNVDIDQTQVTSLNAINKLRDGLHAASAGALVSMISPNGGLAMLNHMGLDLEKVGKIRGLFETYYTSDGKVNPNVSAADRKVMTEAYTLLSEFAKNNPNSDFAQYAKNIDPKTFNISDLPDLLQHAVKGYDVKTADEKNAMQQMEQYNAYSTQIKITSEALKAGVKAVVSTNLNNPEYAGMFVNRGTDKNPDWDIITKDDIKKWLKGGGGNPYSDDKQSTVNKFLFGEYNAGKKINQGGSKINDRELDELAQGYIDGTLSFQDLNIGPDNSTWIDPAIDATKWIGRALSGNLTSGSKEDRQRNNNLVTTVTMNGKSYILPKLPLIQEDFKNLTKKINASVPDIDFGTGAGYVQGSPFYKLNGETRQKVLTDLGHITPTNSNIMEYVGGTSVASPAPEATQQLIRNCFGDKEEMKGLVSEVSLVTSSPTNGGGQAVQVKFSVNKDNPKDPRNELAGRSFFFPITPTEHSPEIFKIFDRVNSVSEFQMNQKNGTKYELNTFESSGVKAIITPSKAGATDGVVELWQKAYNSQTKTYSDTWEKVGDQTLTYDLNATTFPEIKQSIYKNFIDPYIDGRIAWRKQTNTTGGVAYPTSQSIYNTLIKP